MCVCVCLQYMSRRIGHSECQTDSLKPRGICRMFVIFGSIKILWNVQEARICKRASDSRLHLFLYIHIFSWFNTF